MSTTRKKKSTSQALEVGPRSQFKVWAVLCHALPYALPHRRKILQLAFRLQHSVPDTLPVAGMSSNTDNIAHTQTGIKSSKRVKIWRICTAVMKINVDTLRKAFKRTSEVRSCLLIRPMLLCPTWIKQWICKSCTLGIPDTPTLGIRNFVPLGVRAPCKYLEQPVKVCSFLQCKELSTP